MTTLLDSICDHYTDSTASEPVALRSALTGGMVADKDDEGSSRPYCILEEINVQSFVETMNSARVDTTIVRFHVFTVSRSSAGNILELLENCFIRKDDLAMTGREILGRPRKIDHVIINEDDGALGTLDLLYLVEKTPQ